MNLTRPARPIQTSIANRNPELQAKITQMALPLAPLVRLTNGEISTHFPRQLLHYWLLTSDQCDELAHFYHQRTPCEWTSLYPCPVEWRTDAPLEEKRRRIGRFIGLRGCESPIKTQSEDEIMQEIRSARGREDDDEALRRKARWYY